MNYQELLVDASKQLKSYKFNSAKLDAELILSKTLGLSRETILLNLNEKINDKVLENFNYYLKLRKQNKPIAHILGFKDFWKYKFKVDNNVLIPRPETELIIEQALKILPKLSNKNIEIAGSLPTRGETYKSDIFLSDKELLREFQESASILNPYVDLFYLDVLCSYKEIELALESIKNFDKDVIVGIHLKDTGKLPSGENIIGLKEILSNYKIRAVIGGCISPEIYQKVSAELKQLNYEYGFKINAFENIPDDWSITPNANPNLSLGKRTDLNPHAFVDFCKKAISEGASFVGGCCEINHHHIQALSNEL